MEEIAGGRGESVLPYAIKEWFTYAGERINVIASEVYVEIENKLGNTVTLKRSIRDTQKSSKLIEVLEGRHLTGTSNSPIVRPTYLHDPGGAQKIEGFHNFLEGFLGFKLPTVPMISGGETKLYLQAIFAALAIEQKRGWTDYIANIPFFGIRDARTRVVEFLLALDVFKTNAERNRLNADSIAIAAEWDATRQKLLHLVNEIGAVVQSVPAKVSALFDTALVQLQKPAGTEVVSLPSYVSMLHDQYQDLNRKADSYRRKPNNNAQAELDNVTGELHRLTNLYETAKATLTFKMASVREYERLLSEAQEELAHNKTALKLRNLGATIHSLQLANDRCPTCHQNVEDSLLSGIVHSPQMDLGTNIGYLEKQAHMLERQIAGGRKAIVETEVLLKELSRQLDSTQNILNAARSDVAMGATESRAIIRQQVQIEIEIEKLQKTETEVTKLVAHLKSIAERLGVNQAMRKNLPHAYYSNEDKRKIRVFEKFFRANAGSFGYESAAIGEIEINDATLIPVLSHIELREIQVAPGASKARVDIKSDSSASDFVRLIWSYLLALHQTSFYLNGGERHLGILLLDEPGQHSMAESSQRALLQQLASSQHLQSIVAASFDESDAVFREVTQGISFELIQITDKSIRPIMTD
jgi:hypothetical protein